MKLIIYLLCVPIKLIGTMIAVPLMALAVAMEFTLNGENSVDIAKSVIKDIWM